MLTATLAVTKQTGSSVHSVSLVPVFFVFFLLFCSRNKSVVCELFFILGTVSSSAAFAPLADVTCRRIRAPLCSVVPLWAAGVIHKPERNR